MVLISLLIAGCAPPAPSSTITPAPTVTALPSTTPYIAPTSTPLPHATKTPVPPKIRTIQLNQTIDAMYMPGEVRELYVFTSDHARWIGIEFVARDDRGDLRLVPQIYDAEGALIPKVTAPVGQPSLRDVWEIPAPGTYTIQLFGTEPRAFDLRVFDVPMAEVGGGSLVCNETRSGELVVRGQRDQWVFEGQAEDRITIFMLAPGKESILNLYGPDGDLIAHSDDTSYAGIDRVLETVLPSDGTYLLVVRTYDDDQAGTYRLTLNCAD